MMNFNENLYTNQWLDLVFKDRNKQYGAYQLRKDNAETMTRAFFYATILLCSLIILPWAFGTIGGTEPPIEQILQKNETDVSLTKIYERKAEKPALSAPAPVKTQLKQIQYTRMVVAPAAAENIEPPTQAQLEKSVISTVTSTGSDATGINSLETSGSGSGGTAAGELNSENTIHTWVELESMPEFPGGQEAFSKFLRKNLRYPGLAVENGIQGKVIVDFVIEKNGSLSQLKIMRGIGSGCDEEALRVLSKSPKWKPGVQNRQNVRVRYTIPINFSLSN